MPGRTTPTVEATAENPLGTLDLTSQDISCDHCRATIENGLGGTSGVTTVAVDVPTRRIHIEYDESATSAEVLRGRVEDLGYPLAP